MSAGRALAAFVVLVLCAASRASAQVAPNAHWRTIDTKHFHVHFTPALEPVARRAAVSAERAYDALAAQLHPPRGPIDLVVADNVDYANGSTTPFPTNRIIVYAHPPLDDIALRSYDDWLSLVITHEMTHAFYLDRTRGWWRVAQHVFGRSPALFPNLYEPGWLTEGLAVYYESALTGFGRVHGSYERMIVGSTARSAGLLGMDTWSLATTRYPGGDIPYGYGGLFLDYLARTRGRASIGKFVETSSGSTIPFRLNHMARQGFGESFSEGWRGWRASILAGITPEHAPMKGWRDLTTDGRLADFPRWLDDTSLVFAAANGKQSFGVDRVTTHGADTRLSRRNGDSPNVPLADGSLVYSQLELTDPYHMYSDLYRERNGAVTRLTHGARLAEVDARGDGALVAVRYGGAARQLVRVTADGRTIAPITGASPDTEWTEPRWSPDGRKIAAARWTRGGITEIVVLDTAGRTLRVLVRDRSSNAQPEWTRDGASIVFSSDRSGASQLYRVGASGGAIRRISDATTGLFNPAISPNGKRIAAIRWESDGYHVGVAPMDSIVGVSPPPAVVAREDGES
ncbi:MAG: PD40 domain-containing protein, partial [Gemmatimonadaceae bacterium]|nr:PD40 domain-containing protein [Gemmatimonadaceae bacterium]